MIAVDQAGVQGDPNAIGASGGVSADRGSANGVQAFHQRLGVAVARAAPECGVADREAAVDAAARASAVGDPSPDVTAATLGKAIGAIQRDTATWPSLEFPDQASRSVSWRPFGALIPVVAGSSGAGASSVAVAVTDALQQAGRCALLIDADDPARSGLAAAAAEEGPWVRQVEEHVAIRYSWRAEALVARVETPLPTLTPGMMPAPPAWLPEPAPEPLHATVVDLGHGGWRATADPLYGAGGWLRRGTPAQRPMLVVRATRPSLRQGEQVLARLEPWVVLDAATAPCQLVVNGSRRWPAGVVGAAGPRLERLVDDAVFVPHDDTWEIAGIGDEASPRRAVAALAELLDRWGVLGNGDLE